MSYAIVGSGSLGSAIARQFARQQMEVMIANTRGPSSLKSMRDELCPFILPTELKIALRAEIVILAIPYDAVTTALKDAPTWGGRIVVDATNAINFKDFSPADLGGRYSSELVAEAAPGARLVKSFNTLYATVLSRKPDTSLGRRVLFMSGDDKDANATVAQLIYSLGFAPIDLGQITAGGALQHFGGPLGAHSLISQRLGGATPPEIDIIEN